MSAACPWVPAHPPASDEYLESPTEMDLIPRGDGRMIVGKARRQGITRPFTPNRATYEIELGVRGSSSWRVVADLWVLEGGELIWLPDWNRANPETPPVEVVTKTRRRKAVS